MVTLHLGVNDLPYANAPRGMRARKVRSGQQTTGDVAGWLEGRYGIMQAFFDRKQDQIVDELGKSVVGSLESMLMGAPPRLNPFAAGASEIEDMFKQFLSTKEVERVGLPGVPTQAALRGVDHRKKRPYARRPARPSFIDTGLYFANFRAWVD